MKRRYGTSLYQDRLNKIKTLDQDACIGVDVIVGYPSESDEDFLETYNFLKSNDVCLLYTSPSPRDRSLSRMPSSA